MNASQWFAVIRDIYHLLPWDSLSSSVIPVVLLAFKHWLDIEGDRKYKWLFIRFTGEQVMLVLLTAIAAGGAYLYHQLLMPQSDPRVIAIQTMVMAFLTQPVYFFIVKPLIGALNTEIDKRVQQRLTLGNAPVAAENTGTQSFGASQQ